jgi:hypothetical protein
LHWGGGEQVAPASWRAANRDAADDIKTYESWKSGNIGYIVGNQQLKWQHFWQQGSNNWQQPRNIQARGCLKIEPNWPFPTLTFSNFLVVNMLYFEANSFKKTLYRWILLSSKVRC